MSPSSGVVTDPEQKNKNAKCSDGADFSTVLKPLSCQCPTYPVVHCTCGVTMNSATSLTITCANQSLSDSAISPIFDQFPATTPVDTINLSNNTLTKVPVAQLKKYTQLANVLMSNNNIAALAANDFNLTANASRIDLSANSITSIEPNALPSNLYMRNILKSTTESNQWSFVYFCSGNYASGSQILLSGNKLTAVNQTVFQPIVQSFVTNAYPSNTTFIDVTSSKQLSSIFIMFFFLNQLIVNSFQTRVWIADLVCL